MAHGARFFTHPIALDASRIIQVKSVAKEFCTFSPVIGISSEGFSGFIVVSTIMHPLRILDEEPTRQMATEKKTRNSIL